MSGASGGTSKSGSKNPAAVDEGDVDTDEKVDLSKTKDNDSDSDAISSENIDTDANSIELDFCKSKSGRANIIYVVDNTSSMGSKDVTQVRAAGSALLTDIAKLASDKKSPQFHVAVVGFGNGSAAMPNGWVKMSEETGLARSNSDLNMAADPGNRGGDSIPDVGMQDAKKLFDQIPTSKTETKHRNFVLLFTDYGIETDANESNMPVIAQTLANDIGAAIFVIGLGNNNDAVWDAISLPKTGIVSPNHVGKHVRTGTASALTPLFKAVTSDLLSDCN